MENFWLQKCDEKYQTVYYLVILQSMSLGSALPLASRRSASTGPQDFPHHLRGWRCFLLSEQSQFIGVGRGFLAMEEWVWVWVTFPALLRVTFSGFYTCLSAFQVLFSPLHPYSGLHSHNFVH